MKKHRDKKDKIETFDDMLNKIMEDTLSCVQESDDDTKIYHSRKTQHRYEQDAYTVAQNMVDRTEFRH